MSIIKHVTLQKLFLMTFGTTLILKRDLQKIGWETWTGFVWLRIGQVMGSSEHSDEPTSFINCTEFLD